jgi:hypothetical protein
VLQDFDQIVRAKEKNLIFEDSYFTAPEIIIASKEMNPQVASMMIRESRTHKNRVWKPEKVKLNR